MIQLGSKVRDVVSGFTGIAVAEFNFLHGCSRYCVLPPVDVDGVMQAEGTFDEPQLKVVSKPTKEMLTSLAGTLNKKPGGPAPYKPTPKGP